MAALRPLGPYERYSLARAHVGVPPTVAFTALLPLAAFRCRSPSDSTPPVHAAVNSLLDRYTLLRCGVTDRTTTKPRYIFHDGLTAEQVVGEGPTGSDASTAAALEAAMECGARLVEGVGTSDAGFDLTNGPLWRVWVGSNGENGQRRLTLIVHHVISDGTSTRNIMSELLALMRDPPENEKPRVEGVPPTFEQSYDTRPDPSGALSPPPQDGQLPLYLGTALVPPRARPSSLKLLSLPSQLVDGLKRFGKANGVQTLHPTLYYAAVTAMASTFTSSSTSSDPSGSSPSFRIIGCTPYSFRNPALGHPFSTGNYVASHFQSDTFPNLSSTSFWSTCSSFAKVLGDPASKAAGLQVRGRLSLVPDGEVQATAETPARTRWEDWVEEAADQGQWGQTLELSNLGVLPPTGWEGDGLDEVYWVQASSATNAAVNLSPVAVKGGALTITCTYRKCAVDEDTVSRFWRAFEGLLCLLAEGGIEAGQTIEEVAARFAGRV
ncbi:hypothetical protein JCM11251_002740 [Rhodosporidiobolus azoricus]